MNSLPNSFPGSFPGSRTSPTVKQTAQSNQRGLRRWHVNLSAVQATLLLGIATGGMACAFYLGFFAGQKVGLETALNNNLASALRIPITGEDMPPGAASPDEEVTDVYAKLQALDSTLPDPLLKGGERAANGVSLGALRAKPVPELGAIRSTESAPAADMLAPSASARSGTTKLSQAASSTFDTEADMAAIKSAVESAESELRALENDKALLAGQPPSSAQMAAVQEPPKPSVRELGAASLQDKNTAPRASQPSAAKVEISPAKPEVKVAERAEQPKAVARASDTKANIEPPKPANENFIRQTLPKGWFAQVAAPDRKADAEALARKLKTSGFPVMIESATVRGQQYFRVLVGPESTRQQADRLLAQLKREPGLKGDPFIRMVR